MTKKKSTSKPQPKVGDPITEELSPEEVLQREEDAKLDKLTAQDTLDKLVSPTEVIPAKPAPTPKLPDKPPSKVEPTAKPVVPKLPEKPPAKIFSKKLTKAEEAAQAELRKKQTTAEEKAAAQVETDALNELKDELGLILNMEVICSRHSLIATTNGHTGHSSNLKFISEAVKQLKKRKGDYLTPLARKVLPDGRQVQPSRPLV